MGFSIINLPFLDTIDGNSHLFDVTGSVVRFFFLLASFYQENSAPCDAFPRTCRSTSRRCKRVWTMRSIRDHWVTSHLADIDRLPLLPMVSCGRCVAWVVYCLGGRNGLYSNTWTMEHVCIINCLNVL